MVAMWAKMYAMEVIADVGWVDGVFVGTLALSTEQSFVEKPVLLPHRHSEEVQSVGYI